MMTKATKTTAEALPDIIDWFRENGYQFCRVDELKGKKIKAKNEMCIVI